MVSYLDFTSFHQRTVKLLSGPLCVCARLERYKTEALQAEERVEWEKKGGGGSERRLKITVKLLLGSDLVTHF